MRKKPNLIPRMERCAALQIKNPADYKGKWSESFPAFSRTELELGCGKGKFTAGTAQAQPETLLVAVEKVPDAMVVAMERCTEQNLQNVRFIDMDAALLQDVFAPGEVSRIYINFPDPWKKTKQSKRRLTAPAFLKIYESLLPEGGQIHFKTDNSPLFEWSLEQFEAEGWALSEVTRDRHADGPTGVMTDYETKFYEQGVKINRLVATKPERGEAEKCD
jgi:tRNA (guanine-N7-)-methyltransferase